MKSYRYINGLSIFMIIALLFVNGCGTVYSTARDERSVGTVLDDKKIAGKIKYALLRDKVIKGLDIAVYTFTGKIYLVGVVENGSQKNRAVNIARRTEGAKSVTTYLLSKKDASMGKTIDDTAITTKVKANLIADKEMKATQVSVKTIYGNVVLLGVVGSQRDVGKAVQHARRVKYVKSVKSFLLVR